MPLQTVGSAEALLQLCHVYEYYHKPLDLRVIWREIVAYHRGGGKFNWYTLSEYDPENPTSEFLADIAELLSYRFLEYAPDKSVSVTPFGFCIAFARRLPDSLFPLEEKVEEIARARSEQSNKEG